MQFLSLQEPASPPVVRPTRAEAVMISLAAHLLLFLLFVAAPDRLPEAIRRLLQGHAVPARPPATLADADPMKPAETSKAAPAPKENRIPLKFAYVRVPNDVPSPKNPDAPLFSDKDRRARQEVPTPPDALRFTIDPHAEGNSRDRVRPDPSRPEGPETFEPAPPQTTGRASGGRPDGPRGQEPKEPEGSAAAVAKPRSATSGSGAHAATIDPPPAPAGGEGGASGSGRRDGPGDEQSEGTSGDPSRHVPDELRGRTEYKFSFNNPGWLAGGGNHGTLSFDTQGFPWGEYARQIQAIIRNNWIPRIPLAAREGMAGHTCQHFVITRGGDISDIDILRPSSHPPLTRAATDALRASSPLPPLPEEFPNDREGATFCFYYNMYPAEAD